jgi:hypothetical protein
MVQGVLTMSKLSAAQIGIYSLLVLPVIYILFRHGPPGILGWLYLFSFCILRIVGAGLSLATNANQTAAIISNIGLSPLLLAISGVLHEA